MAVMLDHAFRRRIFGVALIVGLGGCSCGGEKTATPCERDTPQDGCGDACTSSAMCAAGLYCGTSGKCTADCTAGDPCANGGLCASDGRCVLPEGGVPPSSDGARPDNVCADVRLEARSVTPTVLLLVDQSSSMDEDFGGDGSRWDVLRDSLLDDPDGLVASLDGVVRFGLTLYSARAEDDTGPAMGECPILTSVPPALDNFGAIETAYRDEEPIDETPTGDSIDAVLDALGSTPDPDPDPTILVLATDGEPDSCEQANPQEGQAEAIAAAQRSFGLGVRLFILSVGEGTVSGEHLQDMANAGIGHDADDPPAPYWIVGDDEGLRTALREIVGGVLSCEVVLRGRIELEEACTGRVSLNGRALECNGDNGWRPLDENRIELVGDACTELQAGAGATLDASFPCNAIIF